MIIQGIIGSFGWGTNMLKYFQDLLIGMEVELIEPVIIEGYPKQKDFEKLKNLSEKIFEKHKNLNLI